MMVGSIMPTVETLDFPAEVPANCRYISEGIPFPAEFAKDSGTAGNLTADILL